MLTFACFLVPSLFICVCFIVDSEYSTHVDYDSILFNCQLCKFEKLNECEFVNYLSHELTNDQMNDFLQSIAIHGFHFLSEMYFLDQDQ